MSSNFCHVLKLSILNFPKNVQADIGMGGGVCGDSEEFCNFAFMGCCGVMPKEAPGRMHGVRYAHAIVRRAS